MLLMKYIFHVNKTIAYIRYYAYYKIFFCKYIKINNPLFYNTLILRL